MSEAKRNKASLRRPFEVIAFRQGLYWVGGFLVLLWLIKVTEVGMEISWAHWGILPRTLTGLMGIIFAPLLHGDFAHLISNSMPLIILGLGLFYFYPRIAPEVSLWIYLSTSFWVWVAARGESYHIGASGVVYGLAAFLIMGGILRRNLRMMTTSMAVLFLYGGMFYGVLPGEPSISWESHLLGVASGGWLAHYFRKEPIWTMPEPEVVPEEEEEEVMEQPPSAPTSPKPFAYTFAPPKEEE